MASSLKRGQGLKRGSRLRPTGLGKRWKMELDKLCREVVFARDKRCQWCHKRTGQMHWAHIRSRRYISSRWDTRNSLKLCAGCHMRWHHQPLSGNEWFKTMFPDRWQAMLMRDNQSLGGKVDREAIRLSLEQELRRYQ